MVARTAPVEIEADAGSTTATVPLLMDGDTIAGLLRVDRRTFQRLVHAGEFAKPLMIGHNTPRWRASDYNAYVARLREAQAAGKRRRRDV